VELIQVDALLDRVRSLRQRGWRLVQIGATRLADEFELTYSFDLNGELFSLRLLVPAAAPRAPSVSSIYGCVVLYENELHDLFGIEVTGMALDFKGNLYKTAVKFPFAAFKAPPAKAAAAPAPSPARPTPVTSA
jgi:ech hydrogenase subunit D